MANNPERPPGAAASLCSECGWTYGTHAPTCGALRPPFPDLTQQRATRYTPEHIYHWLDDYALVLEMQVRTSKTAELTEQCRERARQVREYLSTWRVIPPHELP